MEDPHQSGYLLGVILNQNIFFYIINGLLLGVLLFLSGLISGSEVGVFALTDSEIDRCSKSKTISEIRIANLLQNPRKLLATILILNNLVNIAIVTISTYISWEIVGVRSVGGAVTVVITFSVTVAIVFLGEIVPKVYANQDSLNFVKKSALFINVSQTVFSPLAWVLMSISNVIETRIEKKGYQISVDELNQALELTTSNNLTSEEEKGILKGIVNFGSLTVKQVMKSRVSITAFDIDIDFHCLIDKINKSGFSRIPIYKETIDKIEGILYIKDLLPFLGNDKTYDWSSLLTLGFFVPETKKIDSLLKDFQDKHVSHGYCGR